MITNFYLDSTIRVFKSKAITTHCERFDLPFKLKLSKINLGLISNQPNTSCVVKIYKYEGQQSVPRTETEIVSGILVKKEKVGYEDILVELNQTIEIENEQLENIG